MEPSSRPLLFGVYQESGLQLTTPYLLRDTCGRTGKGNGFEPNRYGLVLEIICMAYDGHATTLPSYPFSCQHMALHTYVQRRVNLRSFLPQQCINNSSSVRFTTCHETD